ncbi:tlde1 domain-containing protein [Erwinia sp. CGal63]|uniref:tlde1 domain-containing protein n=1 Tax=Erwinia sp. CGal63 TaxID=2919889 RepID=UPI003009DAAC
MAWIYYQSTGELWHNGKLIGKGYSGSLTNKNNPDRQHVKSMGPLPRGTYHIGGYTRSKGPMTIILEQTSGESFGRSAFRIHGEKRAPALPGFGSQGCIIMDSSIREKIIKSSDKTLEVVR